jgi:hypothetical protein
MRLPLVVVCAFLASGLFSVSVQAQPRARAVLFEDVDFHGEQRVVDGEVRDFRSIGFNDRVSSI